MQSKPRITIQEYLSIGYVFIVILGIISDVIYYSFLGINIMNYTTILDILITPISILSSNLVIFLVFVVFITLAYFYYVSFIPWFHFKYRDKAWYGKFNKVEKLDEKFSAENQNTLDRIRLVAFLVFSMYIGFGIGRGSAVSSRIENNELKIDHIVTFEDNQTKKVSVLGQNTQYIFYIQEGEDQIKIAPIIENVKTIQKIKKEE